MPVAIHVQRFPCPRCRSLRTIQTDETAIAETLYCPDCGYVWDRGVLSPSSNRTIVRTSALVGASTVRRRRGR